MTITVAVHVLTLDAEVQPRETMSSELIKEYAKLYLEGHELPPITVFQDGIDYWVADGFHRTSAAKEASLTEIRAEIAPGTKRDAILYACGSNKHGKPRSHDDKRRAVDRLLDDHDWWEWPDKQIAQHCGVAQSFVSKRRKQHPSYLENMIATRTVKRGGAIYTMDTSRIGQSAPAPAPDDPPADDLSRDDIETMFPSPPVPARIVEAPALILTGGAVPSNGHRPTFNQTNEMVDWAKWTWNPVTGCLHDCDYCYARDIAERFYPEKFTPTFRPDRLKAPHFTKVPAAAYDMERSPEERLGWRNVFVCSMADLFGKWVPDEWIDAVLEEVRAAQQWNFLFLTKFPQRLASIDWPENAWVGTTVDRQYRVPIAEKAFREVNATFTWLSCEPLLEDLQFGSLGMFDWVVIGGQSQSTRTPAFQPPWSWVEHLQRQARQASCRVFWKDNLSARCREYPQRRRQAMTREP